MESRLDTYQEQEEFWFQHQQEHQCLGCGEYKEVLWPSGYCPECAAKRKVQFTCLHCGRKKPMLAFSPGAIFCKQCQDEIDSAVAEDMEFFSQVLRD